MANGKLFFKVLPNLHSSPDPDEIKVELTCTQSELIMLDTAMTDYWHSSAKHSKSPQWKGGVLKLKDFIKSELRKYFP
jgi:hypothetical protein